jgi:hypothetical protein
MAYFPSNQVTLGSGYTANADSGVKSAAIPASATLAAIASALDIVTSGAGTALQAVSNKVKALEADLATRTLPNA